MSTENEEVQDSPELGPNAPVYDERGNVRPRGTKGARPMTFQERLEIARRLAGGELIPTASEQVEKEDDDAEVSANQKPRRVVKNQKPRRVVKNQR